MLEPWHLLLILVSRTFPLNSKSMTHLGPTVNSSELMWPAFDCCAAVVSIFIKKSSMKPHTVFLQNFAGMIIVWSPAKVVQTVPVSCISWSQGQKICFKIAISILDMFAIWYKTVTKYNIRTIFFVVVWLVCFTWIISSAKRNGGRGEGPELTFWKYSNKDVYILQCSM